MLMPNQPSVWAACKGKAGNHKHHLRLASLSHISCIITVINAFSNRTKYTRDCSRFWALGQITPLYESQQNAEFFLSVSGLSAFPAMVKELLQDWIRARVLREELHIPPSARSWPVLPHSGAGDAELVSVSAVQIHLRRHSNNENTCTKQAGEFYLAKTQQVFRRAHQPLPARVQFALETLQFSSRAVVCGKPQ